MAKAVSVRFLLHKVEHAETIARLCDGDKLSRQKSRSFFQRAEAVHKFYGADSEMYELKPYMANREDLIELRTSLRASEFPFVVNLYNRTPSGCGKVVISNLVVQTGEVIIEQPDLLTTIMKNQQKKIVEIETKVEMDTSDSGRSAEIDELTQISESLQVEDSLPTIEMEEVDLLPSGEVRSSMESTYQNMSDNVLDAF